MPLSAELTDLSIEQLRGRRSVKWSFYEADVLPAWVAEMDFPLADPVRRALAEAVDRGDTGYANPEGVGLGDALAGFVDRRMGWRPDPAAVIACNDVVAGLTELLRVLTPAGAPVIVTPPVYHPFFSLVPDAGRTIAEVPLLAGRDLDLAGIERAFADGARAMLLCNPHNPTGVVAELDDLRSLADLAAAHGAWILSDEIHAALTLPGAGHRPFLTVSENAAARGIALVSASKAFNLAGLGCAQIVTAPGPARSAVDLLPPAARHCGHLGAIAAAAAYDDPAASDWLDRVIEVLDHNRSLVGELLGEHLPLARYSEPAAGYLAWIDLGAYALGADPAAPLLERGRVALSGGPMFGRGGAGFVRLNFGTSPAIVAEAVARMAAGVAANG